MDGALVGSARLQAVVDIAAVFAASFGARALLKSLGVGIAAGPIGVVLAVGFATLLLARRGTSWRALGVVRPPSFGFVAGWSLAIFVGALLGGPLLAGLVQRFVALPPQDLSRFASLTGNLPFYLFLLIPVTWGTAAFGEELLFRGFLTSRVLVIAGSDTRLTRSLVVLAQAALFGAAHAYLGPKGMLNASVVGALSGAVYFANGRNLWPLFVAHGLIDSVGITVLYLGYGHGG